MVGWLHGGMVAWWEGGAVGIAPGCGGVGGVGVCVWNTRYTGA